MSCKSVLWKISAYVDGELPAQERDAVEAHLEACRDCAEAAEEYKRIDEIAAAEEVPHVRGEEWARVWDGVVARQGSAALEGDPAEEGARRSILRLPWIRAAWKPRDASSSASARAYLQLAAAALLVIAGLLAVWVWWRPPAESPSSRGLAVEPKEDGTPTAEHISGPEPEIEFDEEDGSTHLKYKDF